MSADSPVLVLNAGSTALPELVERLGRGLDKLSPHLFSRRSRVGDGS